MQPSEVGKLTLPVLNQLLLAEGHDDDVITFNDEAALNRFLTSG